MTAVAVRGGTNSESTTCRGRDWAGSETPESTFIPPLGCQNTRCRLAVEGFSLAGVRGLGVDGASATACERDIAELAAAGRGRGLDRRRVEQQRASRAAASWW